MNQVVFFIVASYSINIFMVHSFGYGGGPYVNGNGLPYNFPFIPNAIPSTTANTGPPIFPTLAPSIDPRIKRLNAMLDTMLNAKDLQTQIPPSTGVKRKRRFITHVVKNN